jgi:CheY-like chemotaxis protein
VGKGTGLGLSICHGIIASHGGRIYAKSRLNKGTTFFVELPVLDEMEQERMLIEDRVKARQLIRAKVLVIDDEESVRQYLARLLSGEGYQVETVASAAEGLARIKESRYHLVMLDVKMPGIGGPELYQQLCQIAASFTKRTIFITGDTMSGETMDFLKASGVTYLTKPFDSKKLISEINKKLAQFI